MKKRKHIENEILRTVRNWLILLLVLGIAFSFLLRFKDNGNNAGDGQEPAESAEIKEG